MNDSQYNRLLLRMMRKVPDTYRGYINTSGLDRAYGDAQTQRDLNYQSLGQMRTQNNRNIGLANKRFDESTQRYNRNYAFSQNQIDDAEKNMAIANLIGAGNVGVNYLQGRNQAKANMALADLLKRQTAFYNSMA